MMKGLIESLSSNPTGRPMGGRGNAIPHRPTYDPVSLPSYTDPPSASNPSVENPTSAASSSQPEVADQKDPTRPETSPQEMGTKNTPASSGAASEGAGSGHADSEALAQPKLDYDSDDEFIEQLRQSTPLEPLRHKFFTNIDVSNFKKTGYRIC